MSDVKSQIDTYIENAPEFSQPIMNYLRELIHETCPDVEEAWKWSFPNFMYKGRILCSFAAFKKHFAFGFWLEKEMKTMKELTKDIEKNSMHHLGKITSLSDLPAKSHLIRAIKEAMELTELGVTNTKKAPVTKDLKTPDYFIKALESNKKAKENFENASPSYRKEYIMWFEDAKTEATRNKRVEQAIEWISEKKARNWKYEKR